MRESKYGIFDFDFGLGCYIFNSLKKYLHTYMSDI